MVVGVDLSIAVVVGGTKFQFAVVVTVVVVGQPLYMDMKAEEEYTDMKVKEE